MNTSHMEIAPSDLYFVAETYYFCHRIPDSITYIKRYAEKNDGFTLKEYKLYEKIYRAAIDPTREYLYYIDNAISNTSTDRIHDLIDNLQKYRNASFCKLRDLCLDSIDFSMNVIIPKLNSQEIIAYFYKLIGDLHRIIAENGNNDENPDHISKADDSYSRAISICSAKNIQSSPLFLSVTLNYAKFMYDNLKSCEKAYEMLHSSVKNAELELGQLDKDSQIESLQILNAMRTNLIVWSDHMID